MADPISSLNSYSPDSCVAGDDEAGTPVTPLQSLVASAPPNQCLPEVTTESPIGTRSLVEKFPTSSVASTVTPSAAAGPSSAPPASPRFLVTSSGPVLGGSSYRVSGSLMLDEVKSGSLKGSRAEIGTVSVQYGKDNDVQLVGTRGTVVMSHAAGYRLSITGDAGVVRGNLGENNDDGSVGGNIGAGAELLGGEATIDTPVGSVTGGLSVSMSLIGSMGVRDADADGKPEFCAKFSIPAFTLGACVEEFW